MKGKIFLGILLVTFLAVAGLTACSDDHTDEGAEITNYQEYELTVASKEVLGISFYDGNNHFSKVYAVKKDGSQDWEPLSSIQDFDYEEGYEYRIKISETSYVDYRKGEPAWTEYKLLEVISKEEGESEGLPADLLPDNYSRLDVELRYVIEADQKDEVEERLFSPDFPPLCINQYVFNEGFTEFAILNTDNEYLVMVDGTLDREANDDNNFPDSYKLIPIEGQVTSTEQWTFHMDYNTYKKGLTMDAFFVTLPGSTGNNGGRPSQVWLYLDMTQLAQRKFSNAGVKRVVIVEIIGYK